MNYEHLFGNPVMQITQGQKTTFGPHDFHCSANAPDDCVHLVKQMYIKRMCGGII